MKKLISVLALTLLLTSVFAQSKTEAFGVNYTSFTSASLENAPSIGNLYELGVAYETWEVFGLIPFARKETFKLIGKIEYENTSFSYDNTTGNGEVRPDVLHTLKFRLIYKQNLNDKWALVSIINPTLSSDFEDGLSSNDLLFNGGIIGSRILSDRFNLGLGIMSTYAFGEQRLLPVIDVKYSSDNEKFFAQVRFPKLTLTYLASPKLELGFKAAQEGSQYNYMNIDTQGSGETDYIRFSSTNFGPTASYNLFNNIHINTQVGISTSRQLKVFDTSNEEIGDLTPENSMFFNVGLVYAVGK